MDWPVNVALIKNPVNWVIVFLMILMAILIFEMVAVYFVSTTSKGDK